jgi:hypothetical protein
MTPLSATDAKERAQQRDGLVCEHTGLTKPECHCPACVRLLIERHRPAAK